MSHQATVLNALREAQSSLQDLLRNEMTILSIARSGALIADVLRSRGRVFSCGNGGSMCDAIHFAEELSGRFRNDRAPLAATAISDVGHITCTANDFGFDFVFSRYIEANAREGDALLAISTSGTSQNVLKAAEAAKQLGVRVIGLTGNSDSRLGVLSDILIATPAGRYADRVQELHIKVIHIIIELVEQNLFGSR